MGWEDLRPGELLCGVEKSQGLRPGQPIKRLAIIRVRSVRRVQLNQITYDDCRREGFPHMAPSQFTRMFVASHESCRPTSMVTRIEFDFIPGGRFNA